MENHKTGRSSGSIMASVRAQEAGFLDERKLPPCGVVPSDHGRFKGNLHQGCNRVANLRANFR